MGRFTGEGLVWRWKTGSMQQLQRMYYSKMALLESKPPGGAIQPGFLSYQVGYSSTWVLRGPAFQHPWSRASNPQPFLVQFKLKEKRQKLVNLFHSIKQIKQQKKIWLWTFPKFRTLIFLLFLMGEKIELKTLPIFVSSKKSGFSPSWGDSTEHLWVNPFSSLLCFYRFGQRRRGRFISLYFSWQTAFLWPRFFLLLCGAAPLPCGCVCVFVCLLLFLSSWSPKKKKKNDRNVCKHSKRTDRFQQLGED